MQVYLNKVTANTTRLKVKTEPFSSYQNPACLEIMEADNRHFVKSIPFGFDASAFETVRGAAVDEQVHKLFTGSYILPHR